MSTARQLTAERIIVALVQKRYPSHQLLDRLERCLRNREDLYAYFYLVKHYTKGQRYPSLRLLDRLDQCALALELAALNTGKEDLG
jgi:hypothetical protein